MKNYRIELKWALIFVAMTLIWMVLERLGGFHDERIGQHAIVTNLIAIPAIAVYVLALLDKRKNFYGGKMTYTQGLLSGLVITLIVTLFSPLTQYITSVWITPVYFPNMIEFTLREGKMTAAEADRYFSLKNYIVLGLIGAPVMGLITSAVVAIFTRKK